MHLNKRIFVSFFVIIVFCFSSLLLSRSAVESSGGNKRLDIFHYHNIGNIWLRISNYGFFGSGDDVQPQYPSLEYPGGSGIDYLYQGALWFGAQKYRRNELGDKLYWQDAGHEEDPISEPAGFGPVIDTLVSVGFDGDADMYEFLPAYNPLEKNALGSQYDQLQMYDKVASASIRNQTTGVNDDGDDFIDEDPVGFQFPYRDPLMEEFDEFESGDNQFRGEVNRTKCKPSDIIDNEEKWFPFGFVGLGYIDTDSLYNFSQPQDDDGDGLVDEDGYPTSEQDFMGYYYDYSPFGTPGSRWWGGWNFGQEHTPLNIRVRQASFQWSYEYIKNLVYIEFDITNMNPVDTLFNCAMGIYMDSDVGPQSWSSQKASDDISSYVSGSGYEFAYTYDADKDQGLSDGYVGCRVCTPDPEQLQFACWTWEVGNGPRDEDPNTQDGRNQKYWLLTNKNPDENKFTSLRDEPDTQIGDPLDTRFLFGFYGGMTGVENPDSSANWNLEPGETMKIVSAVFPGQTVEELKRTSVWAKTVYRKAQTLTNVVKPDTFVHYKAPGPPDIPKMHLELGPQGKKINVYWNNKSEFTIDNMAIDAAFVGWQDLGDRSFLDSYVAKYQEQKEEYGYFPDDYAPENWNNDEYNMNANLNPWTADRLRHDFQGYTLWKAANSGEKDAFMRVDRWDKIDTEQDLKDYDSCLDNVPIDSLRVDYGGDLGVNTGLPNKRIISEDDIVCVYEDYQGKIDTLFWTEYFHLDEMYSLAPIDSGDIVNAEKPIYSAHMDSSTAASIISDSEFTKKEESLLFKNPSISDELYLTLYDDRLIPLADHLGENHPEGLNKLRKERLARMYYKHTIDYPERGVENYIAVTTFDRGIPSQNLGPLESGRDEDANMKTIFPGPKATSNLDSVYVVPNPYIGQSKFDGRRANDKKGDRSKRLWFVNIPEKCTIKIFTLAGDLVDKIEHNGATSVDVINPSKAAQKGIAASGMHPWDLLSRNNQIIAPGVYIYSVKEHATDKVKLDKFVIIK